MCSTSMDAIVPGENTRAAKLPVLMLQLPVWSGLSSPQAPAEALGLNFHMQLSNISFCSSAFVVNSVLHTAFASNWFRSSGK